jgi:hypothetical protein
MMPNWDIHPEMVTHTRAIDTKTGHPYPEYSLKFMENWDFATGRSTDEMADYIAYALRILKNIGLTCEGVTTPGGFGSKARPQLAEGTFQAVRDVFSAEIPHYFRDLFSEGDKSVAPLVQNASGLDGPDPRCVVHIIGCTGDWTGGWDCTPPGGVDKFITADLKSGRMVDVIGRGEPALMLAHWTGIYLQRRGNRLQNLPGSRPPFESALRSPPLDETQRGFALLGCPGTHHDQSQWHRDRSARAVRLPGFHSAHRDGRRQAAAPHCRRHPSGTARGFWRTETHARHLVPQRRDNCRLLRVAEGQIPARDLRRAARRSPAGCH